MASRSRAAVGEQGRSRLRTLLLVVALMATLTAPAIGGAPSRAAAGPLGSTRFVDPPGDVAAGGMDVTNVTVTSDGDRLTFAIEIPSHATLPRTKHIAVGLDTDRNAATGRGGLDYRLWVTGSRSSVELDRWNGSSWIFVRDSSLTHSYQSGVTIGLSSSSLGPSFDFVVATFGQDAVTLEDGAPNQGLWRVDVEVTCFGGAPTGPPTEGPDVLVGTAGDDDINGLGGDDKICGGAGLDKLVGGAGSDQIDAGPDLDGVVGDGILVGQGDDQLEGGDGTDFLLYVDSLTGVQVNLAAGMATGAGTDRVSGFEAVAGSLFDDVLEGDSTGNFFFPFGGDDDVRGGAGFDLVVFLRKPVTASLATGRATGEGRDILDGIEGLAVCPPAELLDLPAVSNCRSPSAQRTVLTGDRGDNVLLGGDQNDVLHGAAGDDTLVGAGGGDRITGGPGADLIDGGTGNDSLDGGPGLADIVSYLGSTRPVNVNLASGRGRGNGADVLARLEVVAGSPFADVLQGGDGADTLHGNAGDDRIGGGPGDDVLDGGDGSDRLAGGRGADYCFDGERALGCEASDRSRRVFRSRRAGGEATLVSEPRGRHASGHALASGAAVRAAASDGLPRSPQGVGVLWAISRGDLLYRDTPTCKESGGRFVTTIRPPAQIAFSDEGEHTVVWQAILRDRRGRVMSRTPFVRALVPREFTVVFPGQWIDLRTGRPYRARPVPVPASDARLWEAEIRIEGELEPLAHTVVPACPRFARR